MKMINFRIHEYFDKRTVTGVETVPHPQVVSLGQEACMEAFSGKSNTKFSNNNNSQRH